MSSWTPDTTFLVEIYTVLFESVSGPGHSQKQTTEKLDLWHKQRPDFNLYLSFIFSNASSPLSHIPPTSLPSIRAMAGLLLKNIFARLHSLKEVSLSPMFMENLSNIQSMAMNGLNDEDALIRSTSGTLISMIIYKFGLKSWPNWPDLFNHLANMIHSNSPVAVESSLLTISKICEDSAKAFVKDYSPVVEFLIPKLMDWVQLPTPGYSKYAIMSINQFIPHRPDSLTQSLIHFVNILSSKAKDVSSNNELPKLVCKSIVLLFDAYMDEIIPILSSIMEYMLSMLSNEDKELSLEACEFWLSLSHQMSSLNSDLLTSVFPRLIPILLKNMVYESSDPVFIENSSEANDASVPDNTTNIKPRHHHSKLVGSSSVTSSQSKSKSSVPSVLEEGELEKDEHTVDDDEFDIEEEDDDEDDEVLNWNLRKCSAATLDAFSLSLSSAEMEQILLPSIFQYLMNGQDWLVREIGILAIGAAQSGCYETVKGHLSQIIPFLIQQLKDSKPLIRAISCWSLSRYSEWTIEQYAQNQRQYFEGVLEGLCLCTRDRNKRVQGSALNALSSFMESAQASIIGPYVDPILQSLTSLLSTIQKKNMLLLYDTLTTFSDIMGRHLQKPEWFNLLIPLMVKNLESAMSTISDDDRDVFPILECLSSMTISFGMMMEPFAVVLYEHCMTLLEYSLHDGHFGEDDDTAMAALEVITSFTHALSSESFVRLIDRPMKPQSKDQFYSIFLRSLEPSCLSLGMKQSGFAILGDLCKNVPLLVRGHYSIFHPFIMQNLSPNHDSDISVSVTNNAIWAVGEFALIEQSGEMEPYLSQLMEAILPLLLKEATGLPRCLIGNIGVTMGRLALVSPIKCSPFLLPNLENWTRALSGVTDQIEKESSLLGVCKVILTNLNSLPSDHIIGLFNIFNDVISQSDDLKVIVAQIINTISVK